jgi:hypothetical protein
MGDRFDLVMPLAQQGGGGGGFEPFGSNNEYFIIHYWQILHTFKYWLTRF